MARAATTTDAFNAIAEPRRREIIDLLIDGRAHTVGELVERLKMSQPTVSKHLGVLRQVGLVTAIKDGQHRWYKLDAKGLKAVHDWVRTFEHFWTAKIDRIKEQAERIARQRAAAGATPPPKKES